MYKIEELIKKYNAGECTEDEKILLEQWYHSFEWNKEKINTDAADVEQITKDEIWEQLKKNKLFITAEPVVKKYRIRYMSKTWRYAAAAVFLFAICGTTFYLKPFFSKNEKNSVVVKNNFIQNAEILPGTSKAQLILADGRTVILDSARTMQLTEQDGTEIEKVSGKLVYNDIDEKYNGEILFNTLSTPRGGEYQLVLPDGSKVWLNAASSIRFPTRFTGSSRTVFVQGEAYFEVTSNKAMPFKVELENEMTIEVLGTHFNVMNYNDEDEMKTTLAEGLVKVTHASSSVFLSPAKQATVKRGAKNIAVNNVDVDKALAWKNGMIEFDGDNLAYIMRQLSRWYDVDVHFIGTVPKETYIGVIRRQTPLLKVLEILKVAGVRYKMDGRKLTISGS